MGDKSKGRTALNRYAPKTKLTIFKIIHIGNHKLEPTIVS